MGKKIINMIFNLVLVGVFFLGITPVLAESNPKLKINSITQGDNEVEYKDGKYIIREYEYIYINYELIDYDDDKSYIIQRDGVRGSNYDTRIKNNSLIVNTISMYRNGSNLKLKLCDNYKCNDLYDEVNISFDFQLPEYINNSKLYVTKIEQGGKLLEGMQLNNNYNINGQMFNAINYNINNVQQFYVTVKGQGFVDDAIYALTSYYRASWHNQKSYTGKELNDGVRMALNLEDLSNDYIDIYRKDMLITEVVDSDNNLLTIDKYTPDDIPSYDNIKLSYPNYKNLEINKTKYNDYYVLNSNYSNNSLDISFNTNSKYISDKDYNIEVCVTDGRGNVFNTYNKIVSGEALNNSDGYTLTLSDLKLEMAKTMEENKVYYIEIMINDVLRRIGIMYTSYSNPINISSQFYFESGVQNLSAFKGRGNSYFEGGYYTTNVDAFKKYSKIYMNYLGDGLEDNVIYDYILEYGRDTGKDYEDYPFEYAEVVSTGKISGRRLNTIGILFALDNHNNYGKPIYRFTIKKGDEFIFSATPVIEQVEGPSLANARLYVKNRAAYLKVSDSSYVVSSGAPISILVSGLGFKNDKYYKFNMSYYTENSTNQEFSKEILLLGKDLNNGKASVEINDVTKSGSVLLYSDDLDKDEFAYTTMQGVISIDFVKKEDLFKSFNKYSIDIGEYIIKHISKLTKVEDFINNIDVANNGKLKVFDKTGENEVTDKVGTGMLARVINEYDENLMDIDMVVTGDINGDGNISVTDLAKLERHIAGIEKLEGVYKIAADVNDNDSVTLTDLVKVSRDIARLEEIK